MRIKSFRVKNYKSIKDSGICYVQADITILAGKNESGKSALLQALRDFDKEILSIDVDNIRNKNIEDNQAVEITVVFELNELEFQMFSLTLELNSKITESQKDELFKYLSIHGLSVVKSFNTDGIGQYSIGEDLVKLLDEYILNEIPGPFNEILQQLESLNRNHPNIVIPIPTFVCSTMGLRMASKDLLKVLHRNAMKTQNSDFRTLITNQISYIGNAMLAFEEYTLKTIIGNEIEATLPTFVFFSDFEDLLPNEVIIDDAENYSAIKNFQKVTGFSIETLKSKNRINDRSTYCDKYSERFTRYFNDEWHQAEIELKVRIDSDNLAFSIVEIGSTNHYDIDVRSKGFQWFLAFYLMLAAIKAENKIILIDEPGLYLHEKAQKNVLNVLEKTIAPESQILFSTHSPYLIHPSELQRVRLVLRTDENGSVIENSPHKSPDADSLAPIHTAIIEAIGHDPAHGIAAQYKHNVILEGVSDYYLLTAMAEVLNDTIILSNLKLIPSTGATNTSMLASLFTGWGLEYVVILDNDKAGRSAAKELKDKCIDPKIIHVPPNLEDDTQNKALEDLFSLNDFRAYVLKDADNTILQTNDCNSSIFTKLANNQKHPLNKLLWSKMFYDRVKSEQVTFEPETLKNFQLLFATIKSSLNISSETVPKAAVVTSTKSRKKTSPSQQAKG